MTDPKPREFLEFDTPDTRWWMPFVTRGEFRRQVAALWREHLGEIDATTVAFERWEKKMAKDRELYAAVIAGLQALGPAIDSLVTDRDHWHERAVAAEGREATDADDDYAAAAPAKDLVDALLAKVTPAAPDVAEQPPASPEDATEVVNAAPDPDPAPVDHHDELHEDEPA